MNVVNNVKIKRSSNTNLAFEVKETLSVDVSIEACMIENSYSDILIDHEEGLYIKGSFNPVIKKGDSALAYDGYGNESLFYYNSEISKDIVYITNSSGDVIINYYTLKYHDKFLSFSPSVPIVGINLIRDMIDYMCIHSNPFKELLVRDPLNTKNIMCVARLDITEASSEEDIISGYIKSCNDADFISICTSIMSYIKNILNHIDLFTLSKPTYIYMSYIDNESIHLHRSIDIRAYRYDLMIKNFNKKEEY